MAERDKLVYIVVDEASRPTSLGAFEEGDTISSGTLPNNVRTAVEDVDTLNTRVDNLDTSVGDLSTAIDAIEVGAVDASVLAAAQFVTDSSGDIIDTSNAVVTLDTRVGNVETSTTDLSTYINTNESSWTAGLDAGTLADITAVSTVVSDTSGDNSNIVTAYGAYSGAAIGIQYANNTFSAAGAPKTNINMGGNSLTNATQITGNQVKTDNLNANDATSILLQKPINANNQNIISPGLVDGVDISTRDTYLTNLATSSEELSAVITTNTGNIATNTGNIASLDGSVTYLGNASGGWESTRFTVTTNQGAWTTGYNLATDLTSLSGEGFLNGSNPTLNTSLTGTGEIIIGGGVSAGPLSAAGSILSTGLIKSDTSLQSLGNIACVNNITTTTGDIVATAGDVSANGVSVTGLDGRVTTAEGNITTLQTDVAPVTDLVTAYGPVSGDASGVSGAAAVFASVNGTTAVINRNLDFNTKTITNAGNINGVDLTGLEADVTTNSNNISTNTGNIATNTGNIATNTADITTLGAASGDWETTKAYVTGTFNTGTFGKIRSGVTLDLNNQNITTAASVQTETLTATGTTISVSKDINLNSNDITGVGTLSITSPGGTLNIPTGTSVVGGDTFNGSIGTTLNQVATNTGNISTNTTNVGNLVNAFYIQDGVYYTSGLRVGTSGIPFDSAASIQVEQYYAYNATSEKFVLTDPPLVNNGGTITVNPANPADQFTATTLDTINFGTQQIFTPSSNTFSTRNILIGNELSSGPECVVNLEGSTIWASGSVLSAGSGCDITLRGDKFFYGPTNIYGPLGTDLDLDGNNLIDVNNITRANNPLTLQVTGTVTAGNLNIKNTATGIGTAGNVDIDAVGDITLSCPNTISMDAATVTLDGTGAFGLSGGAVDFESTTTYLKLNSAAYLNITAATNLNLNSADNGTQSVSIDGCPFPNPFIQIKANTGLNINSAANVAVTFSGVDVSGGGKVANHYSYNFGTTPTSVQVDTAGIYEVGFNIMVYDPASTVAQRSTHIARITKNGTVIGPGAIGYVRSNSGSNEASYNMNGYIINLASGDDIGVNFERVATTTATTSILPGYDHILTIKRIG